MEAARDIAGLVSNSGNKLMLDSDALLLNRASSSSLALFSLSQLTHFGVVRTAVQDGNREHAARK